jgi:uncharacterized protein (TIGR02246 family)
MTDEQEIRTLVERWAAAVHAGDLEGVLADHAADVVMFDVPPPHDGVRGLDAYRETWPGFFAWQASGGTFDVLSMDVTAGGDVAFVHALVRCDSPEGRAAHPERRLRLTLGLRKEDGRWTVAHEHHSFADPSGPDEAAVEEVRSIHAGWAERTRARDLDGLMEEIADDVVSYEHEAPLAYTGIDAVREVCRRGLDAGPDEVDFSVPDLTVRVRDDLAVAWGLNRIVSRQDGADAVVTWSRGTRVFERRDDRWVMVHQHVSFPVDPASGAARTDLQP